MELVREQCDFGPRVPGTPAHVACRDRIVERFRETGRAVELQAFEAKLAVSGATAPAWNVWALPVPADEMAALEGPFIVVSAHWDTRPVADNDPPERRTRPFLGANDGASGVAVCLELARTLGAAPGTPGARVVFALWDAEDSGVRQDFDSWCVGARFAARNPPAWFDKVALGVNLDMVGGAGMKLGPEVHSLNAFPDLVARLWKIGRALAPTVFVERPIGPIYDDHMPFVETGRTYIDVIGLPYPHWHSTTDTPENCDPASLDAVGRTMVEFLRRELRRLDAR